MLEAIWSSRSNTRQVQFVVYDRHYLLILVHTLLEFPSGYDWKNQSRRGHSGVVTVVISSYQSRKSGQSSIFVYTPFRNLYNPCYFYSPTYTFLTQFETELQLDNLFNDLWWEALLVEQADYNLL